MKCFQFSNGEKKEEYQPQKSISVRSSSTTSTDRDNRRSGSDFSCQTVSDMSADSFSRSAFPSFPQQSNDLRIFSFGELKSATKNFSRSVMIGEGGFGCVYRGTIRSTEDPNVRIEIAVKQLSRKGLQGHKEWLTEVNVLGVVDHPNLVKLVGYCSDDGERGIQRLLIYEYMPNGSVEDHLSSRSSTPLTWPLRLQIALDAARGLTYLHEEMEFQIIFRDLKTSNILLDEKWNAKLSDFGLARQGPAEGLSHVSTAVVGTIGYAAPEYIQTGRLTAKSDIWSYGVVLYELITGRRPLDRNRPRSEQKLLEWVKPYISDIKKFPVIIDPRLHCQYPIKTVVKLAAVANRCLARIPKTRPKMSEVLQLVQGVVENAELGDPQRSLTSSTSEEATSEETKRRGLDLKRRIGDLKMGDGRRLVWKGWRPKLIRTH